MPHHSLFFLNIPSLLLCDPGGASDANFNEVSFMKLFQDPFFIVVRSRWCVICKYLWSIIYEAFSRSLLYCCLIQVVRQMQPSMQYHLWGFLKIPSLLLLDSGGASDANIDAVLFTGLAQIPLFFVVWSRWCVRCKHGCGIIHGAFLTSFPYYCLIQVVRQM